MINVKFPGTDSLVRPKQVFPSLCSLCKSHYLLNRFGPVGTSREIGGMIRDNTGHCNPGKSE